MGSHHDVVIISSRRQPLLRPLTQVFVVLASLVLAASPTVAADGGVEPASSAQCASGQMCFWALLTLPWVFWRAVDEGTPLSA